MFLFLNLVNTRPIFKYDISWKVPLQIPMSTTTMEFGCSVHLPFVMSSCAISGRFHYKGCHVNFLFTLVEHFLIIYIGIAPHQIL